MGAKRDLKLSKTLFSLQASRFPLKKIKNILCKRNVSGRGEGTPVLRRILDRGVP